MYPSYYPLPPPNPYYAVLRAQRIVQAADRQTAILNRQICELTRQNIDLRTKIIKMSNNKYVNDSQGNIGYAKQALKTKHELTEKKFNITQGRRYHSDRQREGMDRAYSFGRLNKDIVEKKQKEFSSVQKERRERRTVTQPNTAPQKSTERQKKYNYLTLEQKKQTQMGEGRTTNTIIEGLSQFNKNQSHQQQQQNPQNSHKPFLRIESQAYNEPIPSTHATASVKKNNRVYLERDTEGRPNTYSPISKLKSIKKLNETEAPPQLTIQSRKTIGKKQYLSLIGSVFDKARSAQQTEKKENVQEKEKDQQ